MKELKILRTEMDIKSEIDKYLEGNLYPCTICGKLPKWKLETFLDISPDFRLTCAECEDGFFCDTGTTIEEAIDRSIEGWNNYNGQKKSS